MPEPVKIQASHLRQDINSRTINSRACEYFKLTWRAASS